MKLSTIKKFNKPSNKGDLIYLGSGDYDYYLIIKNNANSWENHYDKPLLVVGKYSYHHFNLPLDESVLTLGYVKLAIEKAKRFLVLK